MNVIKKILLVGLGFLFLGLGVIGLFLPILPTTPFVLLSVACFSATPRLKAWVMRLSFFREHMENYERRTGLTRKTLWISLSWLWGMLMLSMVLLQSLWMSIFLVLIGAAVTSHILWMARARKN